MSGMLMLVTAKPTVVMRRGADREIPVTEDPQRQQRLAALHMLPPDEGAEHDKTNPNDEPHGDRAPDLAPVEVLALLNAEHDEEHADRAEHDAKPIQTVRVRLQPRHVLQRKHKPDDRDGHVDEEDPLPPDRVDEEPAKDRARRASQRRR